MESFCTSIVFIPTVVGVSTTSLLNLLGHNQAIEPKKLKSTEPSLEILDRIGPK